MSNAVAVCICITGWHFGESFYRAVSTLLGVDVFVVSHRELENVPQFVWELIGNDRIFFAPNEGYDWGCYQQFLETGVYRRYRYVIFMHDDVEILDDGLARAAITLLDSGARVVGNGRNEQITDFPRRWPWCYAHSTWVPSSLDFQHECVRGSFVATTRGVLDRLGCFEVFWDRWGVGEGTGNLSLVASCGKLKHLFGENTFAFLSDRPLASPYLVEHVRGVPAEGLGSSSQHPSLRSKGLRRWPLAQRLFLGAYRRIAGAYVSMRIRKAWLGGRWMRSVVTWPARRCDAGMSSLAHVDRDSREWH